MRLPKILLQKPNQRIVITKDKKIVCEYLSGTDSVGKELWLKQTNVYLLEEAIIKLIKLPKEVKDVPTNN